MIGTLASAVVLLGLLTALVSAALLPLTRRSPKAQVAAVRG
ncbi:hypothetical protein ACWD4F_37275 [Streptomyces aureus]|nr:hypothetical protein [Streptomyces aureus]